MEYINLANVALLLLVVAYARYVWLTASREIDPHPVSWMYWAIIGFVYLGPELKSGIQFYAPLTVAALILLFRWELLRQMKWWHYVALALVLMGEWLCYTYEPESVLWYIAVDFAALSPTVVQAFKRPLNDKPGVWIALAIGFGLYEIGSGSTTGSFDWSFGMYITVSSLIVAMPLIRDRIRREISVKYWW